MLITLRVTRVSIPQLPLLCKVQFLHIPNGSFPILLAKLAKTELLLIPGAPGNPRNAGIRFGKDRFAEIPLPILQAI